MYSTFHSYSCNAALAFVAILLASGCSSEKRVPVFPVSGKVMFQGRPATGAQVVLHPVNSSESNDVAPTATVQSDGSFEITAYESGDGAPQGDYVATVQWFKVTKEAGGPGPNVIPVRYASARTSPIKVSVNGGPTQVQPILLK
jgi:hypothetical protein